MVVPAGKVPVIAEEFMVEKVLVEEIIMEEPMEVITVAPMLPKVGLNVPGVMTSGKPKLERIKNFGYGDGLEQ